MDFLLGRNCLKLLSPSTGIDWLAATGSTLDYKNLTIFMDCNNPQQDKTSLHRFSYDLPTVAIAQVGSSQLWTMCFGCVSSSAPRPLEWTIVQLGLNMLGHRTRGTTFSNSSNLENPMPKTLQFLDRCNPFLVRRVSGNVPVPMVCTVPSRQEPKCK